MRDPGHHRGECLEAATLITAEGVWILGFQEPFFKSAMDAAMASFVGIVKYTGLRNNDGWEQYGAVNGLEDAEDIILFFILYYELREKLVVKSPALLLLIQERDAARKAQKERDIESWKERKAEAEKKALDEIVL